MCGVVASLFFDRKRKLRKLSGRCAEKIVVDRTWGQAFPDIAEIKRFRGQGGPLDVMMQVTSS